MNPKSILARYLTKQTILNFLSVLLMILGVILLFEVVELLRKTSGRDDVSFFFIVKMALAKLPQTVDMVLPFVMMISAMMTFWGLSKSNEFVVIRAAGVSIWGFLCPVLLATFFIGVVNITVVNPVSSRLFEMYETMDYRLDTKNPKAVLFSDEGLWIREAIDDDNFMVLQAKSLRQEKNDLFLRDVSIIEMDRRSQPKKRIEAFAATLFDGHFVLKDARIFEAGKPTEVLNSLRYDTVLTETRIKENFVDPNALSFWVLPGTIKFYEQSGFATVRHNMRYLSLLVSPFLLVAMVLVAAVFALRPNGRRGGIMFLIVGGIATGFVVYFSSQVIYAFGLNGFIPELLAVWTPTLVAALISISILLHLEDG